MNIPATAHAIYHAIKGSATACAAVRGEYSSLALAIATDPDATSRVTSATVNGQTFSAQPTMTNGQRLHLLRWVVACLENGGPISPLQAPNFD